MSVEEARGRVLKFSWHWQEGTVLSKEDIDSVDRLILEVQAAMPCYKWFGETKRDPCPSCKAREKLKVPV